LAVALPEARLAAEAAGRRADEDDDLSVEEIEAELDAGRFAGLPLLDSGDDGSDDASATDDALDEDASDDGADDDGADDDAPAVETDQVGEPDDADEVDDDEAAEDDDSTSGAEVTDIFARLRAESATDDSGD